MCQAVKARGAHTLEGAAYYSGSRSALGRHPSIMSTHRLIIVLAAAQPTEKATKTVQLSSRMRFRPYISLSFDIQTAHPIQIS